MGIEPLILNDGLWSVEFHKTDNYVTVIMKHADTRAIHLRINQAQDLQEWLEYCLPAVERL